MWESATPNSWIQIIDAVCSNLQLRLWTKSIWERDHETSLVLLATLCAHLFSGLGFIVEVKEIVLALMFIRCVHMEFTSNTHWNSLWLSWFCQCTSSRKSRPHSQPECALRLQNCVRTVTCFYTCYIGRAKIALVNSELLLLACTGSIFWGGPVQ